MPGYPRPTRRSRPPIGQTLSSPDNRLRLLKFLLYRQAPGDTGARGMVFCVHKEVPALGPAPLGGVPSGVPLVPAAQQAAQAGARDAVLQVQSDGSQVFGKNADGRTILVDPKNVAVAPDGKLYV